jgi:hypothetical protein
VNQGTNQPSLPDPLLPQQVDAPKVNQVAQFVIDPRCMHLTCYNCGEPEYFVGICDKPKLCFICAIPEHYMTVCPRWKETQQTTTYFESAGARLGFFHIFLPRVETTRWLNINNCGVIVVKKGAISLSELEQELSEIFCNK